VTYDIKIRGGSIVDGTGAARYSGDVGIRNGRIVALGEAPESARRVIDADGLAVAPGFVDIHTHYDAQIMWDPLLSISPWHGVTTAVMGSCGFGVAPTRPSGRGLILRTLERVEAMSLAALEAGLGDWGFETFPQYLDAIERKGVAINVGVMVGHTPTRLYVMGEDAVERAARPDEIESMQAIVREAMRAGAIAFATSVSKVHVGFAGKPVPSRLAEFDEMRALARAVLRCDGARKRSPSVLDRIACGATWQGSASRSAREERRTHRTRFADLSAGGVPSDRE
jgi:N-acyl-D-amino-acid deacylase